MTRYPLRKIRTELPIAMVRRRWIVGEECGDVFDDGDFDGLTLTIELHNETEAERVIEAIKMQKEGPDT